jgi:hypothetical protein
MKFIMHLKHKNPLPRKWFPIYVSLSSFFHNLSLILETVQTRSVLCMLYLTSTETFNSLISNPKPFDTILQGEVPIKIDIIFNPEVSTKFGAFKKAMFGLTSHPVFGILMSVCIKQCWYTSLAAGK